MEVIHESPNADSFTPLSTHLSQTPESFYSGPPVLYHHSAGAKLVILESELRAAPALSSLRGAPPGINGTATNGDAHEHEHGEDVVLSDIDIWVTSEYVPTLL